MAKREKKLKLKTIQVLEFGTSHALSIQPMTSVSKLSFMALSFQFNSYY